MGQGGNDTSLSAEQGLEKCLEFLNSVGIKIIVKKIEGSSFLPGLSIEGGCIVIDKESLKYPGDILHQAGHVAIVPAAERAMLNAAAIQERPNREAEEMMAIAWSYAATVHLNIDPYFVFHNNGYLAGGRNIADNFKNKRYFAVPMLQWIGLTAEEKTGAALNVHPYPHMLKWLRD